MLIYTAVQCQCDEFVDIPIVMLFVELCPHVVVQTSSDTKRKLTKKIEVNNVMGTYLQNNRR